MMAPHQAPGVKGYRVLSLGAQSNRKDPVITPRCLVVVLCHQGEAEWELNLERVKLGAGCRLVFSHVSMFRPIVVSPEFRAVAVVADEDMAVEATEGIAAESLEAVLSCPTVRIDDESQWSLLQGVAGSMERYESMPPTALSRRVAVALLRSLLMLLCESCQEVPAVTSVDIYFREFINHLSLNVRTEHEMSYYASLLNITPRYLAEVCKVKAGRTAKEIISEVVVSHIKRELSEGSLPLAEIAVRYGFADQSSMGKFFRKMSGESPLAFRNRHKQKSHL